MGMGQGAGRIRWVNGGMEEQGLVISG